VIDLKFALADVLVVETSAKRNFAVQIGAANVKLDYNIVSATFAPETDSIFIHTKYEVSVLGDDGEGMNQEVLHLTSGVLVVVRANREINQNDAASGLLDSAQRIANSEAHSYHRQLIRSLTIGVGFPQFEFPVEFGIIESSMQSAADVNRVQEPA
jgi:hypothetical protein